jgi:hypothetical protein
VALRIILALLATGCARPECPEPASAAAPVVPPGSSPSASPGSGYACDAVGEGSLVRIELLDDVGSTPAALVVSRSWPSPWSAEPASIRPLSRERGAEGEAVFRAVGGSELVITLEPGGPNTREGRADAVERVCPGPDGDCHEQRHRAELRCVAIGRTPDQPP